MGLSYQSVQRYPVPPFAWFYHVLRHNNSTGVAELGRGTRVNASVLRTNGDDGMKSVTHLLDEYINLKTSLESARISWNLLVLRAWQRRAPKSAP